MTYMTLVLLYSVLIQTALARFSEGGSASARRDTQEPLDASGKMDAPQQTARGLRGARSTLLDEGPDDIGTDAKVRNSLTEFTTGECHDGCKYSVEYNKCILGKNAFTKKCSCDIVDGQCLQKGLGQTKPFNVPTYSDENPGYQYYPKWGGSNGYGSKQEPRRASRDDPVAGRGTSQGTGVRRQGLGNLYNNGYPRSRAIQANLGHPQLRASNAYEPKVEPVPTSTQMQERMIQMQEQMGLMHQQISQMQEQVSQMMQQLMAH